MRLQAGRHLATGPHAAQPAVETGQLGQASGAGARAHLISPWDCLASANPRLITGRSLATISGNTDRKWSTSASVLKRPSVTRSEPRARIGSRPIARSTCDGCPACLALQALPAETAIPA